ncbi:hypothetical protein ANN_22681 [Periplaneta americana]|uniref:HTH psq-type domain-containing protein n=1 Tax=Periplaneta americana TaxID=6978 RepID=A0ABQ8S8Z3_PERAM|nr:hypothetical protein ANN_22681 [Periplaneta americana]
MGSFKAARIYNVPQTTLERYVKDEIKSPTDVVKTKLGRKQYLPSDLEKDLAEHCILLEERYFGLSQKDLRRSAFQLAEKNGIAHPFSKESESAGRKWEIEQWLRQNGGRAVTIYQVSELLGKAYARAATVESAMNGFRKAGLYPCDRNVFRQHDFPHSNTSESPIEQMSPLQRGTAKEIDSTPSSSQSVPLVGAADKKLMNAKKRKQRENERAKGGTSSGKRPTSSSRCGRSKRRLPFVTDTSDSEDDVVQLEDSDEDMSEDEEDAECLFCAGRFSEDNEGEDWIRCCKCFKWSHTLCAGSDDKIFICDLCK